MRVVGRVSLFVALFAAPLLLLAGRPAVSGADPAADGTGLSTAAQQFYMRVLGDWVGTAVSRLNGAAPATGYFHLVITRIDDRTFREDYTFYRIHPGTGVLECSGTQAIVSTIDRGAVIHQTCRGKGTILIDLQPKKQSFEASGEAHFTPPDHVEAVARGTIAVDGMPMNMGKHGTVRKATAAWWLEGRQLVGQTRVETNFRAWFFSRHFRFETQLRARRGTDVATIAGRLPASQRAPGESWRSDALRTSGA